MSLLLSRRRALIGLFCAPAIIKLAPLMKIKPAPRDWRYISRIVNINTSLIDLKDEQFYLNIIEMMKQSNAILNDLPFIEELI